MVSKRQARDQRQPGTSAVLTARDKELLLGLARLRIGPTSALAKLFFGDVRRDTAAKRIRRLFDSGHLSVRVEGIAEESLYMLGPKGRAFVRAEGGEDMSVPRGSLEHHLGVVETWVALATLGMPGVDLQLTRADWELRSQFVGALPIVPDLFVVLGHRSGSVAMAIEVDLGTEPLKVLRAKLETYRRIALSGEGLFGWPEFGIGVALRGRGRVTYIRELLADCWQRTCLVWCLEEGPKDELTRLVSGPETPLTSSPGSKGMGGAASAMQARTIPDGNERL